MPGKAQGSSRVLVTGGTGFVGRHAVDALLRMGVAVHVASRDGTALAEGALVHRADLLREGTARELVETVAPDAILHLAWCVEPGRFWSDPANLNWAAASLRLARAAAEGGVRRFVGVGTCYEYDWPSNAPCVEGITPLAVHTLYDAAKAGTAAILRRYFADVGVEFAWARLFHLYGPGEDARRFVPSVARALVRGEQARCTSGLQVRDFLDVRDAGAALSALVASDYCGDVNIGSDVPVSLADLAKALADIAGRPDLLRLGAIEDQPGEPRVLLADTRVLGERVGFAPQFNLATGLAATIDYWRENEAPIIP